MINPIVHCDWCNRRVRRLAQITTAGYQEPTTSAPPRTVKLCLQCYRLVEYGQKMYDIVAQMQAQDAELRRLILCLRSGNFADFAALHKAKAAQ